ncbi:putative TIM-barrel protein, nifR3 family [Acetitomaculum ruminis DSM 5522]|uniref:tRNA-dihydrouridine synthase n=1 Tax=Acetitomaculum ruminis DSM 5522 TaxID=1120918 RepID=A0A1I0X161_9FIRM|nr:tRNA dihydrouridine synthase DusB [Acetitomaculum ruminis]SFA94641.1 putative TIM-barrel protein, nifR3 family [Acetitomaculum ruminis DSM 5522]
MKIGNVKLKNNVVLGPMAGVTDLPFRRLCHEFGAGLVCSEMISAKAIFYKNKGTKELLNISKDEHPVSLQLFGSDPDIVSEMALQIEELPFDILDFNMGCPVPKVVNNSEGSALMKNPELAYKIVKETVKKIKKPMTVKIRTGFDKESINCLEVAKMLEDAGASALCLHGRTREQYYSGEADWEMIAKVKDAISIPLIGNGDINSPQKAKKMLDETGCDGVMVGRSARGNPWIFKRINAYLENNELIPPPDMDEICDMIIRHSKMLCEYKGEYIGVREMRKHTGWYTAGLYGATALRRQINKIESLNELIEMIEKFKV